MTNPDDLLAEYLAADTTKLLRKRIMRRNLRRRIEGNRGDSAPIVNEVRRYLAKKPALRVVASFSALPGEIDLGDLLQDESRTWVFPKVEEGELVFYQVKNLSQDLVAGAYGILEPGSHLKRFAPHLIDLFLCPGLGFDHSGARIGRGKGYYDRILAEARPDAQKLGVCFGFQLVDKIDTEEHDIPMNGVIAG